MTSLMFGTTIPPPEERAHGYVRIGAGERREEHAVGE